MILPETTSKFATITRMKDLKIAVFGSSSGGLKATAMNKAMRLGGIIAERGHTVITGACTGLPYEAVRGAMEKGGQVVGYSPWTSREEHEQSGDPVEGFTELFFVPASYEHAKDIKITRKYRNVSSSAACDACVIVAGQYGTLNEFTNAYDFLKPIGVLAGTGGFADMLQEMTEKVRKEPRPPIVFSDDPEELVIELEKVMEKGGSL